MAIKAYSGNEPYIFISYSHRDTNLVYPIIEELDKRGYRVWYDQGIDPGTEWDENIAMHINECSYFIAFMSQNYLNSSNCKDELNYARDLEKERLVVYLETVTLPAGMAMRINRLQSIFKYSYTSDEDFYDRLVTANNINICFGGNVAPVVEAAKAEEPKVEATKVEAPKDEEPKAEEPKVEAPKVEAPNVDAPKVEAPKVEESKVVLNNGNAKTEDTKPAVNANKPEPTVQTSPNNAQVGFVAKNKSLFSALFVVLAMFFVFLPFFTFARPTPYSIIASILFIAAAYLAKSFIGRACLIFTYLAASFIQLITFIMFNYYSKSIFLPFLISIVTLILMIIAFSFNKKKK